MIVVTGANGKLGQLVIKDLIQRKGAHQIVAAVRQPEKAIELKQIGVEVRQADYNKPDSLVQAFSGADQVLLISSSEIGQREAQHKAVIQAAQKAGVKHIVYTSILGADKSTLGLSKEHLATEKEIIKSGLTYTILRNGWYLENHTENMGAALEHGVVLGAAGEGQFSSASRADYAAAAAQVLTSSGHENKIYELAGSQSFTLEKHAEELSVLSGKNIVYKNMPEKEFENVLMTFGLPQAFANLLADSDTGASKGGLFSSSNELSVLIGRPTMTLAQSIQQHLK